MARANLGRAQKNLAASLTQAYKNGGNDDLAYLLASSSFSDLVDNVSVLEKASNASGQLLTTIVKYKKEVSTQEATLQTETAKLHQELGEMAQRKQAIESADQLAACARGADLERHQTADRRGAAPPERRRRGGRRGGHRW